MNLLSPTFLAWLLPATYLIHLLEEYFGGEGFPVWLSRFMNANLSAADFLLINGIIHSFGDFREQPHWWRRLQAG